MLKKAGFVAVAAAGMLTVGGTALAAPASAADEGSSGDTVPFSQAYEDFIESGGNVGEGAAGLVASAYAGIAATPHQIVGE